MANSPDRTKEPEVKGFGSLSIPSPAVTTLPNGIELHALDAGDQPLNRITVSYPSGMLEADIPDALQLAAQLLREGTASWSGSQISEMLDYQGAWLKADAMSHDTAISLWSLNRSTAQLLPLLGEILTSPAFPVREFATLRDKHRARYELSQKNVGFVAAQLDKRLVFGEHHPINRQLTADEISALTRDDVVAAYRKAFAQRPRVFVTGQISAILPGIVSFFGNLDYSGSSDTAQLIVPMSPAAAPQKVTAGVDAEHQAAIALSIPSIGREHPDYIALRLVVMALGGYFGSRLMANIREDKGYTYGIQANLLGYREGGVVSVSTNTAPQYADAVIAEVKHELERLRTEPMADDELTVVKNTAMTSLAAILDSPFSMMDHHISRFHTGTPEDYFAKQAVAIRALTPDSVMQLARKYLDPSELLISVAQPGKP